MFAFLSAARLIRTFYNVLRAIVGIVGVSTTVHRWATRRSFN